MLQNLLHLDDPIHAVCIVLEENIESINLSQLEQEFNISIQLYPVKRNHHNPTTGCRVSHRNVIKYAKSQNWPHVLILEEDAILDPVALSKIEHVRLPDDWEMLYLGYNGYEGHRVSKSLIQLHTALTTHAYMVRQTIYNDILNLIDTEWWNHTVFANLSTLQLQTLYNTPNHPIDIFYKLIQERHHTYGLYPMICYQQQRYSIIEKCVTDYQHYMYIKSKELALDCDMQIYQRPESELSLLPHDLDAIWVSENKQLVPKHVSNLIINHPDWDVIQYTPTSRLVRRQWLYHKQQPCHMMWHDDDIINPSQSLLASVVNQFPTLTSYPVWISSHPIILFYNQTSIWRPDLAKTVRLWKVHESYTKLDLAKKSAPMNVCNFLPCSFIWITTMGFFLNHHATQQNIILYIENDNWKNQMEQDLFHNFQFHLVQIIFSSDTIAKTFCQHHEVYVSQYVGLPGSPNVGSWSQIYKQASADKASKQYGAAT